MYQGRPRLNHGGCVFKQKGYDPTRSSRRAEWLVLLCLLGLCLAVAIAGGGVTAVNVRAWYLSLHPPPATPPNAAFAPAWTILYAMIAVAAWLVWRHPDEQRRGALALWGWQLLLSALWAPLFFGLHLILPALAVIGALLVAVAFTVVRFLRLDRAAGLLMLPYLAWVGLAGYLNAGFWWLNG